MFPIGSELQCSSVMKWMRRQSRRRIARPGKMGGRRKYVFESPG